MKTYYPHFTEKGMEIQIHKAQNSQNMNSDHLLRVNSLSTSNIYQNFPFD